MEKIKHFWERWKKFGRKIADFQGRVLLTISYFLVVIPIGLLSRVLNRSETSKDSNWTSWKTKTDTLEEARNQF